MLSSRSGKPKGSFFSNAEKDAINEQAEKIQKFVFSAQYRKAFELAELLVKRFPRNRFAKYQYAVALGDCEEWATPEQHRKNSRRAARILRDLLKRSNGVDPVSRRRWRNEYYWFSKQPYKQWKLGVAEVKSGMPAGNYSKGVGAVSLSLLYLEAGQEKRGRDWASRSVLAWTAYLKYRNNYYNAHVWHAKALGLLGDIDGMERSLARAAKLSGRSPKYSEFQEVRKTVSKVLGSLER
ncbi:MAG: hypothetical protein ACXVB9_08590 [Bdellovibrionota bacterium]